MEQFVVLGKPQGKGRPRFRKAGAFVQTYTPKPTQDYENKVREVYSKVCHNRKLEGMLTVTVRAYFEPPKSISKKKRELLIGNWYDKKPDADNIGKIICDALNKIAYKDDNQIVCLKVEKKYDNISRVEVKLEEIAR